MNEAYVKNHIEHGINTIEFYHPQSNSLPGKILEELAKEIHFAGTHDDTKVIILKSAGEKTFCAGASFDELAAIQTEKEGLSVYPNPTADNLKISQFENPDLSGQVVKMEYIEIQNVLGEKQLVNEQISKLANEIQIDVSRLATGIYFLKATDNKGFQQTTKFVKQ